MEDLDFSPLDDGQLVTLIRAACGEAARRGAAVAAAARDAYLDAAERATVARTAAEAEAERIRQEEIRRVAAEATEQVRAKAERERAQAEIAREQERWGRRKAVALEVVRLFGGCRFETKGLHIIAWKKPGGTERRIFIQYGFNDTLFTYYVTGNAQKNIVPGKREWRKDPDLRANADAITALCKVIAALWIEGDIDVTAAAGWAGEPAPLPDYEPAPLVPPKPKTAPSSAAPAAPPAAAESVPAPEAAAP